MSIFGHKEIQILKAEREQARALAEDPTIFEYDAVHDEIEARRNRKTAAHESADKEKKVLYQISK